MINLQSQVIDKLNNIDSKIDQVLISQNYDKLKYQKSIERNENLSESFEIIMDDNKNNN